MGLIYLTGMMGSGKTVVSALLARRLACDVCDSDACIVAQEGMSIAEIFDKKGEAYFRECESRVLREIASQGTGIVATGGGIIIRDENRALMKQTGIVIYLYAPTHVLFARLQDKTDRPLLTGKPLQERLDTIFMTRSSWYNEADMIIDTTEKTPEEVCAAIEKELKERSIV